MHESTCSLHLNSQTSLVAVFAIDQKQKVTVRELFPLSRRMRPLRKNKNLLARSRPRSKGNRAFNATLVALTVLAVALIAIDRINPQMMAPVRSTLLSVTMPIVATVSTAVEPLRSFVERLTSTDNTQAELQRLRDQNAKLKLWKWRAKELEKKLEELSELANVLRDSNMGFVTTRVATLSQGPFGATAFIKAGTLNGIKVGDAVVDRAGLVGTVSEVQKATARVRLITDQKTKLHVLIGPDNIKAALSATGDGELIIVALAEDGEIDTDDEVIIDGQKDVLPDGVRVGLVYRSGSGELRVTPYAKPNALGYVSVLVSDPENRRKLTRIE